MDLFLSILLTILFSVTILLYIAVLSFKIADKIKEKKLKKATSEDNFNNKNE